MAKNVDFLVYNKGNYIVYKVSMLYGIRTQTDLSLPASGFV